MYVCIFIWITCAYVNIVFECVFDMFFASCKQWMRTIKSLKTWYKAIICLFLRVLCHWGANHTTQKKKETESEGLLTGDIIEHLIMWVVSNKKKDKWCQHRYMYISTWMIEFFSVYLGQAQLFLGDFGPLWFCPLSLMFWSQPCISLAPPENEQILNKYNHIYRSDIFIVLYKCWSNFCKKLVYALQSQRENLVFHKVVNRASSVEFYKHEIHINWWKSPYLMMKLTTPNDETHHTWRWNSPHLIMKLTTPDDETHHTWWRS